MRATFLTAENGGLAFPESVDLGALRTLRGKIGSMNPEAAIVAAYQANHLTPQQHDDLLVTQHVGFLIEVIDRVLQGEYASVPEALESLCTQNRQLARKAIEAIAISHKMPPMASDIAA